LRKALALRPIRAISSRSFKGTAELYQRFPRVTPQVFTGLSDSTYFDFDLHVAMVRTSRDFAAPAAVWRVISSVAPIFPNARRGHNCERWWKTGSLAKSWARFSRPTGVLPDFATCRFAT